MPNYLKLIPAWLAAVIRGNPQRLARRPSTTPFLVIGHRGAPCVEVENTMASFRRAVEQDGANGLECDLCLTKDQHIVLWHDWEPDAPTARLREAGMEPDVCVRPCPPADGEFRRPLSELTLAEFCAHFGYGAKADDQQYRACMPLLEELLDWVVGRREIAVLFLDIKLPVEQRELVPVLMEGINKLLERYRPTATLIFECAAIEVLTAMQAHSPQHQYALDIEPPPGIVLNPGAYSAVRPALDHGNRYATLARPRATMAPWTTHRRIVQHDLRLRRRLQRADPGRPLPALISFTIDAEEELRTLVKMGVEGIQTNRPELLRQIVDAMGVRLA